MGDLEPRTVSSGRRPALPARAVVAWALGVAGLLAYNWWVLVPLKPGLLRSPNELYSNLEVIGHPYAAAMLHADLSSGLLLLGAFVLLGRASLSGGRGEWLALLVYAAAVTLGGAFPEVCADGINESCRAKEWTFQLPLSQYLHSAAGIVEFGGITAALLLAVRRTRGGQAATARVYRFLARAALAAYPLLGVSYLLNRLGAVMEAVFFTGFTLMVLAQIAERAGSLRRDHQEFGPASPGVGGSLFRQSHSGP